MDSEYRRRVVDDYFRERLGSIGAILIEGPKWCGKTTTGDMLSASALFMQDPDNQEMNLYYANTKPSVLLEGDKPRLIDEWQVAPNLWNAVRASVDREHRTGLYILTGSSVPALTKEQEDSMHSGIGRIAHVRMRTMTLFESGESDGSVSLRELFDGRTDFIARSGLTLDALAVAVCRGGWPFAVYVDLRDPTRVAKDYVEALVGLEISRVDRVRRSPDVAFRLLRSLSRNICTLADITVIVQDMGDTAGRSTVLDYMDALRKIFVIEDIPAWTPALLSKARVRKSVKRNLADPSIAAAALNIGPEKLMQNPPVFGSFFESLCIRDLRVYSQVLEGRVYHYHDNSGLEVDAVIELSDGRWAAIEIKLHSGEDQGARNLLRLKDKTVLVDGIAPSFLAVLTGTGFFHRRDDGVLVIPIGCLRDRCPTVDSVVSRLLAHASIGT